MLTINLFDANFAGQAGSVAGKIPRTIQYVRDRLDWEGITLFTDAQLLSPAVDLVRSTYKVGWLHEGRCSKPDIYEASKSVRHKFDAILTYAADLLAFDPVYRFVPRGGVWIDRSCWGVYPKSRQVSLILSEKTSLPGHRLRHQIADSIPGIDLFGARGQPIGTDKARALRDYRYSIVIEPCKEPNYFTEHLLDCFAFGTVPLYSGCPNIHEFFHVGGIHQWSTLEGLRSLLKTLTDFTYRRQRHAITANLRALDTWESTDDWICQHVLEPMLHGVAS